MPTTREYVTKSSKCTAVNLAATSFSGQAMLVVRTMTVHDLPLAMRLKSQAGWNQTEADWRRFMAISPRDCFIAELDGAPVATTVACVFGEVAWLAMVLVDEPVRGQGIGTTIVRHAVEHLDRLSVQTIRLDATPLGKPVYEKLGFVEEYAVERYGGVVTRSRCEVPESAATFRVARADEYAELCRFDQQTTGTDRRGFLMRLFAEWPENVFVADNRGALTGYVAARHGSNAVQVGPCLAIDDVGLSLLAAAARRHEGARVVIDVPELNVAAARITKSFGMAHERSLLRMRRGPAVAENASRIWASSGPELG
jgi:GNAT superfamily N-acetyltransferase